MSLAAPPQIDDTTPRLAFLMSGSPAALAGGEERATGYRLSRRYSLRDPFMGLPAVSGAPMDAQNVTSPSAIRYIAIYA